MSPAANWGENVHRHSSYTHRTGARVTAGVVFNLAVVLLVAACSSQAIDPGTASPFPDPGKSGFEQISLPASGTVGSDPATVAQQLFGKPAPLEGRYSQEIRNLASASGQRVILFTQSGLADDSVRGTRHRLEFVTADGRWRLDWAGRQVSCWPGRGHEDWSTEACR
jgi:hypothetical protein